MLWVLGVCREVYGMVGVKTPTWEYLLRRCVCPPTMVSGRRGGVAHVGEVKLGLYQFKIWCVFQDLVPDVQELILSQVPVE